MARHEPESFIARWARLKHERAAEPEPGDTAHAAQPAPPGPEAGDDVPSPPAAAPPPPPDPARLGIGSDFARYLCDDVAPGLRVQALRRLWDCDPELSRCDGLIDYAGDYSDAATVPEGPVVAAFRAGIGLLSDEEARAWAGLGRSEPAEATEPDAPGDPT